MPDVHMHPVRQTDPGLYGPRKKTASGHGSLQLLWKNKHLFTACSLAAQRTPEASRR